MARMGRTFPNASGGRMRGDDVRAPEDDGRSCEYSVVQKIEGKWIFRRILLIALYAVFAIGYFAFCVAIKFYPIACFTPLFTWILIFFTWRYVNVTYRYEISSGDWIFTKILNDRHKKKMFRLKVKDAVRIAPYADRLEQSRIETFDAEKTLWAASTMDSPDLYFALFTDEDDQRTVLYFEATAKALRLLHFYNKNTVLSKVRY